MLREKLDFIISHDNTNNDNYTTLKRKGSARKKEIGERKSEKVRKRK